MPTPRLSARTRSGLLLATAVVVLTALAVADPTGVELISATEQIDATPVGQLMHGILSAFNEYRSREDGADISYKMAQKAKSGGTIGRAPIGYLNTIDRVDGREIRAVGIDEERAPFIKLAFDLYASGEHTMDEIVDELTDRGLTTRPTAHRPAGPVSTSKMSRLLRDRYYLGEVVYKGERYEGRHPALIDRAVFDKVQTMLETTGRAGERKRLYAHYLKGSLWCGECRVERGVSDSRMIVQRTIGRSGQDYFYFFCRARQDDRCESRHLPFDAVEDAVIDIALKACPDALGIGFSEHQRPRATRQRASELDERQRADADGLRSVLQHQPYVVTAALADIGFGQRAGVEIDQMSRSRSSASSTSLGTC